MQSFDIFAGQYEKVPQGEAFWQVENLVFSPPKKVTQNENFSPKILHKMGGGVSHKECFS